MANKTVVSLLVLVLVVAVAALAIGAVNLGKLNTQAEDIAALEAGLEGKVAAAVEEAQAPMNSLINNLVCNGFNTLPWPASEAACKACDKCFWKDSFCHGR